MKLRIAFFVISMLFFLSVLIGCVTMRTNLLVVIIQIGLGALFAWLSTRRKVEGYLNIEEKPPDEKITPPKEIGMKNRSSFWQNTKIPK